MRLSEFVLTKVVKNGVYGEYLYADVSVTTGRWWWRKCVRRKVYKPNDSIFWCWQDTGELAPNEILAMAEATKARELFQKEAPQVSSEKADKSNDPEELK